MGSITGNVAADRAKLLFELPIGSLQQTDSLGILPIILSCVAQGLRSYSLTKIVLG